MIHERHFVRPLDFGPTGNKLFLGLRYEGTDGKTLTLRTLGLASHPVVLDVTGEGPVEAVDAFGNTEMLRVKDGKMTVRITTLPLYLRLTKSQEVAPIEINYGRNYAAQATFTYSGKYKGDLTQLTDGIFEAPHPSNPHREVWSGELTTTPQTLEMTFPHPRTLSYLVIYTVRADNPYCALLDFDVEYHDGKDWRTVEEVRSPMPASNLVETPQCRANTWYLDENCFAIHFAQEITTARLRLVVRRTTHGFMPDELAVKAAGWSANPPHLMLRDVEIYGPPPPQFVTLSAESPSKKTRLAILH
jgi:hypothetical protein